MSLRVRFIRKEENSDDALKRKKEKKPLQNPTFGLGGRVVVDVFKTLFPLHQDVYLSNYFTSVARLEHLAECGVNACVTVYSNRTDSPLNLTGRVWSKRVCYSVLKQDRLATEPYWQSVE